MTREASRVDSMAIRASVAAIAVPEVAVKVNRPDGCACLEIGVNDAWGLKSGPVRQPGTTLREMKPGCSC